MKKFVSLKEQIELNFRDGVDESGREKFARVTVSGLYLYRHLVDNDRVFNCDGNAIRASVRVDAELRRAAETSADCLELEDEDIERLKNAAETPSAGYPCSPARRIQPFIDALHSATNERPVSEAPVAKAAE